MKFIYFACLAVFLASCSSKPEIVQERMLYSHLVQIAPEITPDMQSVGYWIAQTDTPDELIMTTDEIVDFNKQIAAEQRLYTVSDMLEFLPTLTVNDKVAAPYNYIYSQKHYFSTGKLVEKSDLDAIGRNINFEGMKTLPLRHVSFGVTVERIDLRVLPTDEMFLKEGDDGYFDRLQMSSLEIGTPVAILWRTYDQKWLFIQSSATTGWVHASSIAYCSQEELAKWEFPQNFVVVTNYRASIYADPAFTKFLARATVGNVFMIDSVTDGVAAIKFPIRGDEGQLATVTGYLHDNDINIGYVPYTTRNTLTLAFSMLNAPYGWGGMFGEQDCSGFTWAIFRAVGIVMPRNSAVQARIGVDITDTAGGIAGATTIQMPGHIMLYIGRRGEDTYVIHSTWNFREKRGDGYILKMPARTIVSKLENRDGVLYYSERAVKDISVVRN